MTIYSTSRGQGSINNARSWIHLTVTNAVESLLFKVLPWIKVVSEENCPASGSWTTDQLGTPKLFDKN